MDQQKNTGLCVKCEVKVSGLALVCLGVWWLKVVFFLGGVRVMRGFFEVVLEFGDGCCFFFFACFFFVVLVEVFRDYPLLSCWFNGK